jgi:hypothetical protein
MRKGTGGAERRFMGKAAKVIGEKLSKTRAY